MLPDGSTWHPALRLGAQGHGLSENSVLNNLRLDEHTLKR
jgi:hypothetical protein